MTFTEYTFDSNQKEISKEMEGHIYGTNNLTTSQQNKISEDLTYMQLMLDSKPQKMMSCSEEKTMDMYNVAKCAHNICTVMDTHTRDKIKWCGLSVEL